MIIPDLLISWFVSVLLASDDTNMLPVIWPSDMFSFSQAVIALQSPSLRITYNKSWENSHWTQQIRDKRRKTVYKDFYSQMHLRLKNIYLKQRICKKKSKNCVLDLWTDFYATLVFDWPLCCLADHWYTRPVFSYNI